MKQRNIANSEKRKGEYSMKETFVISYNIADAEYFSSFFIVCTRNCVGSIDSVVLIEVNCFIIR